MSYLRRQIVRHARTSVPLTMREVVLMLPTYLGEIEIVHDRRRPRGVEWLMAVH
jgi:hypothetical protein